MAPRGDTARAAAPPPAHSARTWSNGTCAQLPPGAGVRALLHHVPASDLPDVRGGRDAQAADQLEVAQGNRRDVQVVPRGPPVQPVGVLVVHVDERFPVGEDDVERGHGFNGVRGDLNGVRGVS